MSRLEVGDTVKVLRAARLPLEDVLGIGPIERITRSESDELLYWVRGFACARSERELRLYVSLVKKCADQDESSEEQA